MTPSFIRLPLSSFLSVIFEFFKLLFLSSVTLSLFRFFLSGVSQNQEIIKRAPHNPPYCGWPLFYCIYNFLYCFHITSFLNSLFDQTPSGTGLHRRHRTDSVKQALIFSFWSFLIKYHYYKRHKHKAHYNHQEISIFTLHEVNDFTYKFFHCTISVLVVVYFSGSGPLSGTFSSSSTDAFSSLLCIDSIRINPQ